MLRYRVVSHLGSGQFGSVDQGVWRRPNDSAVDVALKTLNEGASEQDKVRFLQEGAIMAQFRHPNIVSLYGIVCKGGPVSCEYITFAHISALYMSVMSYGCELEQKRTDCSRCSDDLYHVYTFAIIGTHNSSLEGAMKLKFVSFCSS